VCHDYRRKNIAVGFPRKTKNKNHEKIKAGRGSSTFLSFTSVAWSTVMSRHKGDTIRIPFVFVEKTTGAR
jgi:hypothetical protein